MNNQRYINELLEYYILKFRIVLTIFIINPVYVFILEINNLFLSKKEFNYKFIKFYQFIFYLGPETEYTERRYSVYLER